MWRVSDMKSKWYDSLHMLPLPYSLLKQNVFNKDSETNIAYPSFYTAYFYNIRVDIINRIEH